MKKKLLILIAFAAVLFGASSCSKRCYCITEFIGFDKESIEEEIVIDKNSSCRAKNRTQKVGEGEVRLTCKDIL